MGLIDWNLVWNNEMLATDRARLNSGAFWDETIANEEGLGAFGENLTEHQLEAVVASSRETVLEIGSGWGRLTLPRLASWQLADHVILFDLLDDLGVQPEVSYLGTRSDKHYASIDGAVTHSKRFFNAPPSTREAMHDDVASVATDDPSGGPWIRRNEATAVVRWWTR